MVEVEIAKRELSEKRQLEATKLELHRELKRKIALETMLNTLNVSLIGHLLVLGLVICIGEEGWKYLIQIHVELEC